MSRPCLSIIGSMISSYYGFNTGFDISRFILGVGTTTTVPASIYFPLLIIPISLSIAAYILTYRFVAKYLNKPATAISGTFLLNVSMAILMRFATLAVLNLFVTTAVNPFTLPFLAAVGASVLCVMAIHRLSKLDPTLEFIRAQEAAIRYYNRNLFLAAPQEAAPRFAPYTGKSFRLTEDAREGAPACC